MSLGQFENILSFCKGLAILVTIGPLFLDLSFTLAMKVNPSEYGLMLERKLEKIMMKYKGIKAIKSW